MPYTPPSQRSPVASQSNTPPRKLSNQYQAATETQKQEALSHGVRPNPPRSSSQTYLHKHRRSPSVSKPTAALAESSAPETNGLNGVDPSPDHGKDSTKILSQEVDSTAGGADSSQSSSDEDLGPRGWSRDAKSLAELQAAIRGLEVQRQGSPVQGQMESTTSCGTSGSLRSRLEPPANIKVSDPVLTHTPPLSAGARKISHSRSTTDASAFFDFPRNKLDSPAGSGSENDLDEDDLEIKPSLIRKKSGELVRPALRPAARRRPSSMPGTPTYSKNVHFQDTSLEHVRTFLQVDRPIAVSAGSSPVDNHDEESEFPFGEPDSKSRSPAYEWELKLANFPRNSIDRQALPVRTEKVFLSADKLALLGTVAVQNLAFHKLVYMRFSLDYWKTTSEVKAEYNTDVRKKQANDGCDRFIFEIKLEDLANLENKTMFFCVKYEVNGQQYWDNNDSMNYQVDFAKKLKDETCQSSFQPAANRALNGLPRSKPSQPRPRSMPSFDDFGSHTGPFDFGSFPQPNSMVGESPVRFKNRKATPDIIPDAPAKLKSGGNQQAFGNRYDFGASLSAAIQSGSNTMPKALSSRPTGPSFGVPPVESKTGLEKGEGVAVNTGHAKPTALVAGKPSLQSPSYNELIDKYCFFGSAKPLPQPPTPNESNEVVEPVPIEQAHNITNHSSDASPIPNKAVDSASSSPPRSISPTAERKKTLASSVRSASPRASRSTSPVTGSAIGSRSHSPGFGYPYHSSLHGNFFESHPPTPIPG